MILYWGIRAASYFFSWLPVASAYAIAVFIADLIFPLVSEKRRNALENMAQVLGPNASAELVEQTVKAAVHNYARYVVDFLRIAHTSPEEIERRIHMPSWSPLDDALARGQGAIFVGMHMGSWDIGAAYLAQRGYPVHAVVDTFKHPHLNHFIQTTRSRTGLGIIPVHQAYRRILKVLRDRGILGVLIDRPTPGEGVRVQFFGRTTYVPAGAAVLSLRTGAPVLAMAILRQPGDRFLGLVSPAITIESSGDHERDVQALTQSVIWEFEKLIRQHPDQWYMFRPMWQSAAPALEASEPVVAAPAEIAT